jgi:hypothetical protein
MRTNFPAILRAVRAPAAARLTRAGGLAVLCFLLSTCSGDKVIGPPPVATQLAFTISPGLTVAGATIAPAVVVEVQDQNGDPFPGFTGSVTLEITTGTGTGGATLSGTTTLATIAGIATFSALSIDKSGTGYTLSATTTGLTTGTSASFTINAGPAAQLAFTGQPTSETAGTPITPAVGVTAQDALGNTVPSFTGAVTVTITAGTGASGATLSGTATVTAAAGVASFANLRIDKTGVASSGTGYTLTASSGTLTGAISDPFDITTGSAAKLAFLVQPTTASAGGTITPLVDVAVLDTVGNTVTSFTGNVTVVFGANPAGGALSGTTTVAAVAGVATFSDLSIDKVGSGYALSATAPNLTSATSTAFDITPGVATALEFTVQPGTTTAGAAIAPAVKVTARDSLGNVATGFNGNVTMAIGTNPAGGVLSGAATVAAETGVATFSTLSINAAGSGYTLSATAADLAATASTGFNIIPSTASRLVFTTQPSNRTAGTTMAAIQVTAQDASGNAVTGFAGAVTVAITAGSGASGAVLSGTTTVGAAGGVATFATLSINKSGTDYAFTATAPGLTADTSAVFAINAGPATQLVFTVPPSNATAGAAITPQIEVTARDAQGNTADGFTGNVTVAIGTNPAGGVLSGATTVAAVAGVAAFANLSINAAGSGYALTAAATGPAGAVSAAFDVTAAQADRLVFTVQPTAATAGATITPAIQATARDSLGNTVTTFTANVTLTITAGTGTGGATLSGTTTVTAVAGVAQYATLSIDRSGIGYQLSATGTGVAGATSASFDITAGTATQLAFTTQPTTTTAATVIAPAVQVAAQDAQGNTVTSFTGNIGVTIGTNPGSGTLSGTASLAAVGGVATFANLSIDKSGAGYTLTAASGVLAGATSATFDINAGPATQLVYTVQPSIAASGATIAPAMQLTARDAQGNTATGFTDNVTLAIATNPAGGTLSGTTTVAAVLGVATFSTVSIDKAGVGYTLSATATGLLGASSAPFDIIPGPATILVFSVQPTTATTNANIAPAVKVTARDALGNTATAFNGNITVNLGANPGGSTLSGTRTLAAVNGTASYQALSLNNVGTSYTLTATAAGLTGATSTPFNIIASVGTVLFFTGQPQNGSAGAALSPSVVVTARDASGQTATSFNGAVTVAITSGTGAPGAVLSGTTTVNAVGGIATFADLSINKNEVGYKFSATAAGLTGATSAFFTINPGPATQLVFTLQPSAATAGIVITPRIEVTARDAQGNTATGFTGGVTVAIGTNPAGGTLSGTTTVAGVGGIASFSTLSIDQPGNGYTLTATAVGPAGATSAAFNVSATLVTQLVFTRQPSSTTAGAIITPSVRVTARNSSGQTETSFTGNVTLTITAGTGTAGSTLSGTTTVAAVAGVATFATLNIDNSGSGFRLSATAAGVSGALSAPFTINPGAPTRVVFTVQPASTTAGTIIPGFNGPSIQATVRDALGNPVKTFAGNVTVSVRANPSGGTLSGTTTLSASAGVGNFNDLSIDRTGTGYRLDVTSVGLASDTSDAFSITGGAATQLRFTVQPSNAAAGATIAPPIRVTALDAFGNIATGFTDIVTLAIGTNPAGGTLSGTTAIAAANGVAVFTPLSINNAGVGYRLTASAAGVTAATSTTFNIN